METNYTLTNHKYEYVLCYCQYCKEYFCLYGAGNDSRPYSILQISDHMLTSVEALAASSPSVKTLHIICKYIFHFHWMNLFCYLQGPFVLLINIREESLPLCCMFSRLIKDPVLVGYQFPHVTEQLHYLKLPPMMNVIISYGSCSQHCWMLIHSCSPQVW